MTTDNPDFKHPEYLAHFPDWGISRVVSKGSRAVKSQGTKLLPGLSTQTDDDYSTYKLNAIFYTVTKKIISILAGAVFRLPYTTNEDIGEKEKVKLESISIDGLDFSEFAKSTLNEILTVGRNGILVEMTPSGEAVLISFKAENILNWSTELIDGKQKLSLVVLREFIEEKKKFESKTTEQLRVLLLKEGKYVIELYRKSEDKTGESKFELKETTTPDKFEEPLDFIPFTFISSEDTTPKVKESPTLEIANINLAHYRTDADYRHGLRFTALPTLLLTGFDPDEKYAVGSQTAIITNNENGDGKYLEFQGKGLDSLVVALADLERQMIFLGVQFGEEKKGVEGDKSQMIRKSTGLATLSSVTKTLEAGLNQALRYLTEWQGLGEIKISLNKDFLEFKLDVEVLKVLQSGQVMGQIPAKVVNEYIARAGLLPDDLSVDDIQAELDSQQTKEFNSSGDNNNGNQQREV
jgi:hypothetical protein